MKVFEKDQDVFFLFKNEIKKGKIDRNNGIKNETYTVLFEINEDLYKEVFPDHKLFKNKELLEKDIKEVQEQIKKQEQIEKERKLQIEKERKEQEINNAEYNIEQYEENILYYEKNIKSFLKRIEQYEKDIQIERDKIEYCKGLLSLKLSNGSKD